MKFNCKPFSCGRPHFLTHHQWSLNCYNIFHALWRLLKEILTIYRLELASYSNNFFMYYLLLFSEFKRKLVIVLVALEVVL